MSTDLSLCQQALVKLGANSITSFVSGTAEANVASALYAPTRDALLSACPWGFATKTALLVAATAPNAEFSYAYAIPADCLRVISLGSQDRPRGIKFQIRNNSVQCDATDVYLTYVARVSESTQPAYFDAALVYRLAAEFCIPLTENTGRAEALFRVADDEMKRARQTDAQQHTPQRLERFSLIDARG